MCLEQMWGVSPPLYGIKNSAVASHSSSTLAGYRHAVMLQALSPPVTALPVCFSGPVMGKAA
jgi:hypothetical protein